MTTFLHARDNGYKNFWNIDADDIGLYAKLRRIVKLFKTVKEYANAHKIDMLALDVWHTLELGGHWSFGVVYTDCKVNWLNLFKEHCTDKLLLDNYKRVYSKINIDWLCTSLNEAGLAKIGTFCVENLRMVHHSDDIYSTPTNGLKYWEKGNCYFGTLSDDFKLGKRGSLPIPSSVVNIDIGLTARESLSMLERFSASRFTTMFKTMNDVIDSEITVILPLDGAAKNIGQCLQSLLNQTYTDNQITLNWGPPVKESVREKFKSFRLVITATEAFSDSLETCHEFEKTFGGRMKILTGVPREKIFEAGLQAAKGRYVMFINGDEVFLPEALEFLHNIIENTHSDVVHTSNFLAPVEDNTFSVMTREGGWEQNFQAINILPRVNERISAWFNGALSPSIYDNLISREFLEEEKISLPCADDSSQWIFSLQCLMLAEVYTRIAHPAYIKFHESSNQSYTHTNIYTKIKSLAKSVEALEKLDDEVFYFEEYADAKNLLKDMFNKNFLK